jgi:hypothetical protein
LANTKDIKLKGRRVIGLRRFKTASVPRYGAGIGANHPSAYSSQKTNFARLTRRMADLKRKQLQ